MQSLSNSEINLCNMFICAVFICIQLSKSNYLCDPQGCLDHIIAKLIVGKLWKSPTCCKLFNCKTHPMRLQALLHNMAATLLNRESYIVPLEKMAYLACENRVMKFKDVLDNKVPEKKMNSATKSS